MSSHPKGEADSGRNLYDHGTDIANTVTSSTSKPTPAVIGPLVQTAPRGAHRLRAESLKQLDSDLDAHLHSILSNHTAHTIIFIGVPASGESSNLDYESENTPPGHNSMHTDLKRDVDHGFKRAEQSNSTNPQEKLALFEKYQFLSPGEFLKCCRYGCSNTNIQTSGIFMGLVTVLLLLSILYVGVSAIAGLEVSYMSFSKEMGPNAQKKQQ